MSCLVRCGDGSLHAYDCVQHEGKLWLVSAWAIDHELRIASPERMVRLDMLRPAPRRDTAGSQFDYVDIELPIAVIEGDSDAGFEVRDLPCSPIVDSRELRPLPLVR